MRQKMSKYSVTWRDDKGVIRRSNIDNVDDYKLNEIQEIVRKELGNIKFMIAINCLHSPLLKSPGCPLVA
jgi:hypothetical protein